VEANKILLENKNRPALMPLIELIGRVQVTSEGLQCNDADRAKIATLAKELGVAAYSSTDDGLMLALDEVLLRVSSGNEESQKAADAIVAKVLSGEIPAAPAKEALQPAAVATKEAPAQSTATITTESVTTSASTAPAETVTEQAKPSIDQLLKELSNPKNENHEWQVDADGFSVKSTPDGRIFQRSPEGETKAWSKEKGWVDLSEGIGIDLQKANDTVRENYDLALDAYLEGGTYQSDEGVEYTLRASPEGQLSFVRVQGDTVRQYNDKTGSMVIYRGASRNRIQQRVAKTRGTKRQLA
jgi:hypothetical protein